MFADSMLETSWAQRSRRSWTTLTSFGVQAAAIGALLMIPLLRTVGLPMARALPTPISWGAPPPPRPMQVRHTEVLNQSNLVDNRIITPPSIPAHVAMIDETAPPPQVSYNNGPGVPGGTGSGGSGDGILKSLNESIRPATPVAAAPKVPAFRTSSMLQGMLIRRVDPIYPPLARNARIQGSVVLDAVISKAGTIENLRLISGHPLLVGSAIDAVRQWRYRPYVLNDEVIEVETQITVNFVLAR